MRLVSNKIGSRQAQTTVYWDNTKTSVVCGCRKNITIKEFEQIVLGTHKKNKYSKQYMKFIKVAKYAINNMKE